MLNKRFWKGFATVSVEMLFAMAVFTAGLVGLVFWIKPWVKQHKDLDLQVFDWLKDYINEGANQFMLAITYLGSHHFLVPANIVLILFFLFVKRHSWLSIRIAAIGLSSLIFTFSLKYIFMRQRPDEPLLFEANGYSFPSGHAIISTTFYGLLIYIVSVTITKKAIRWLFYILLSVLILLICFSRVYLRVHYTSDVSVGFVLGISWLLISLFVLKRIEDFNKKKPEIKPT